MASTIVEHVVLFKLKESSSTERTAAQVSAWRSLENLDTVVELTAGPVLDPAPLASGFTHAIYGRYKDRAALEAYNVHPTHQKVVQFGHDVVENVLAVDWEGILDGAPAPAAAFHIVLLTPKDGSPQDDLGPLTEVVRSYKALLPPSHANDSSSGANFSAARGQGYNWGFVLRFQSAQALEEFRSDPRQLQLQEQKLRALADNVIVLDLVRDL